MYDGGEAPAPASGAGSQQPLTDWTTVKSSGGFDGDEDMLESTVAGGGSLKDHLEDAINSLRIVFAADESMRTGEVVRL